MTAPSRSVSLPFRISSVPSSRARSYSNLAKVNEDSAVTETYAKFDEFEASFYSHLPYELSKLRNAGIINFFHSGTLTYLSSL